LFEKIIDLTHPLNTNIPTWDGLRGFSLENDEIRMFTSSGTHIDAPAYFSENGFSVDTIPLPQLVAPACVIDLSKRATEKTVVSPEDITHFEASFGPIAPNSLVIAYTGWSRHWPDMKTYRNEDVHGQLHFPTWGVPALEMLLTRQIAGVAIDTLALEPLNSSFPGHNLLMRANKYIIENIANCHLLPPKGATIITLPLKIEKGSESPARVVALIS
jgi:kynurenine formamidase